MCSWNNCKHNIKAFPDQQPSAPPGANWSWSLYQIGTSERSAKISLFTTIAKLEGEGQKCQVRARILKSFWFTRDAILQAKLMCRRQWNSSVSRLMFEIFRAKSFFKSQRPNFDQAKQKRLPVAIITHHAIEADFMIDGGRTWILLKPLCLPKKLLLISALQSQLDSKSHSEDDSLEASTLYTEGSVHSQQVYLCLLQWPTCPTLYGFDPRCHLNRRAPSQWVHTLCGFHVARLPHFTRLFPLLSA